MKSGTGLAATAAAAATKQRKTHPRSVKAMKHYFNQCKTNSERNEQCRRSRARELTVARQQDNKQKRTQSKRRGTSEQEQSKREAKEEEESMKSVSGALQN